MANVLNTGATLICGHGGTVTLVPSGGKLKAGGADALTATMVVGAAIVGCTQVGPGLTPCTAVVSITGGIAAKLKEAGNLVLLDTLAGTTNGVPSNNLLAATSPGQTKLKAG